MKKIIFLIPLFFLTTFSFSREFASNNMPHSQNDTLSYIPGIVNETARLFSDMDNSSSVILYIPADSAVRILSSVNDYFLVRYQGIEGYVFQRKIRNNQSIRDQFNQPAVSAEVIRNNLNTKRYQELVSKYGRETGEKIYQHKIWKGMQQTMVMDSWGRPQKINHWSGIGGTKDEWIYPRYILVFWDSRLTSWYERGKR